MRLISFEKGAILQNYNRPVHAHAGTPAGRRRGQCGHFDLFSVLLASNSHPAASEGYPDTLPGNPEEPKKYTFNDVGGLDDYLKLKAFSSKGDGLPTYSVALGTDTNPEAPLLQTDIDAFR